MISLVLVKKTKEIMTNTYKEVLAKSKSGSKSEKIKKEKIKKEPKKEKETSVKPEPGRIPVKERQSTEVSLFVMG